MQGQKLSKVERERLEADKMKYELVSQRKRVEDELNNREEYHMPDQEPGQTMSKKYELLTARYRSVQGLLCLQAPESRAFYS